MFVGSKSLSQNKQKAEHLKNLNGKFPEQILLFKAKFPQAGEVWGEAQKKISKVILSSFYKEQFASPQPFPAKGKSCFLKSSPKLG